MRRQGDKGTESSACGCCAGGLLRCGGTGGVGGGGGRDRGFGIPGREDASAEAAEVGADDREADVAMNGMLRSPLVEGKIG